MLLTSSGDHGLSLYKQKKLYIFLFSKDYYLFVEESPTDLDLCEVY